VLCILDNLSVLVLDTNDNRPSFPPTRLLRISESTPIGSLITTITANDVDESAILRYSLLSHPDEYFAINTLTGQLVLIKQLHYEQYDTIKLQVEVGIIIWMHNNYLLSKGI
jgi:hypothetical protein